MATDDNTNKMAETIEKPTQFTRYIESEAFDKAMKNWAHKDCKYRAPVKVFPIKKETYKGDGSVTEKEQGYGELVYFMYFKEHPLYWELITYDIEEFDEFCKNSNKSDKDSISENEGDDLYSDGDCHTWMDDGIWYGGEARNPMGDW